MILFEKISWKNFLSTGNVFSEIDLESARTNLIVGSNGAGKSTILDALTFSLFAKPFRKISKSMLVNSINEKDCVVEIEFRIGKIEYKVVRGMKPNKFEIYCNGQLWNQESTLVEQQKNFEANVLKMNYKSFTQIVVLGSSTFVPFMRLPLAQRREIIEDILDIQVFSTMNVLLLFLDFIIFLKVPFFPRSLPATTITSSPVLNLVGVIIFREPPVLKIIFSCAFHL